MSLDLEAMFTKVQRMWLMFASNPVLPADATKFLDGTGAYTVPPGTAPASALAFAGGQTTEGTTTSTTDVTVVTATVSIAATLPILVIGSYRASTGAAAGFQIGLKLNSTVVLLSTGYANLSADNTNRSGQFFYLIGPRQASYLRAAMGYLKGSDDAGPPGSNTQSFQSILTADMPTATITSVGIQGHVGDALVTLGIDNLFVYTLAVA